MDAVQEKASRLIARAEPYAMALVVRCESPTSAKPGARGLVSRDGIITGWIGGGCAQPIVVEESLKAIQEGTPRLLRITPKTGAVEVNGIRTYEMVCYSGGTMDIFIEPVLPLPQVVILGRSPVARTLARIAKALRYEVIVHAPDATAEDFPDVDRLEGNLALSHIRAGQAFVVVSTQGEDDEGAVEAAVRSEVPYVAFVASKKKWDAVRKVLAGHGLSADALNRVQAPAGIEISAVEPEEIALSIMAQIVKTRRDANGAAAAATSHATSAHSSATASASASSSKPGRRAWQPPPPPEGKALDPICGMHVDIKTARHTSVYAGQTFYFCCGGCKSSFEQNPAQHLEATA
jgi:xanthine dehydrogenase accessory factor